MDRSGLKIGTPLSLGSQRDWENQFHVWGSPPGERELARCERAVKEVRAAVKASPALQARDLHVFPQGSYRNRVNVRRDSDVDVGVLCKNTFFYELPAGKTAEQLGITPSSYKFLEFKNELGAALEAHFGRGAVTRGSKAFDIKASNQQVEADVAPFFEHRRYTETGGYASGVELRPDNLPHERVINWPEQHYEKGVAKHERCHQRFKKLVRILKCLRNEMDERGRAAAKPIPSFLIECLVYNAPTRCFGHDKWSDDVKAVLEFLRLSTADEATCREWIEVSGFKWLFRPSQRWTRQQAHDFLKAAEAYLLVG